MTYKDFIEKLSIAARHTRIKGYVEERERVARQFCDSIKKQYGVQCQYNNGCGRFYTVLYNGFPVAEINDGGDGTIAPAHLEVLPFSRYYTEIDIEDTELGEAANAMKIASLIRNMEHLEEAKLEAIKMMDAKIEEIKAEIYKLCGGRCS